MSIRAVSLRAAAGAFLIGLSVGGAPAAPAAGPFDGFSGTWKGDGIVTMSGSQEAIRCRAVYTVSGGGNALSIDINCASDATRVNIVSNLVAQDNSFSGSWHETTRGLSGDVSGRVSEPNTFQASLETVGGGLQVGARTNGKVQAITITSQGSEIQGARITLRRG